MSLLKTTTAFPVTLHIPLCLLFLLRFCLGTFCTNWWNTEVKYVGRVNNIHHLVSRFRVWPSLSIDEAGRRDGRAWNMEAICNSVHIARYFTPPSAPHPLTTNHPSRETRPGAWDGSFWGAYRSWSILKLCGYHRQWDLLISVVFSAETDFYKFWTCACFHRIGSRNTTLAVNK